MALDYDGANSGIFTRIGKLTKYVNSHLADATTTLPAELKAIADLYEAADLTGQVSGIYGAFDGLKADVAGLRQTLAGFADATLLDRDTVLSQLGVTLPSLPDVLAALHQRMLDDAETVRRSAVTLGSPAVPTGSNTGTGVVLVTKVLDGYSPPLLGAQSHVRYNGLSSELAVPAETMYLACVGDSMTGGTAEGAEQFNWSGGIQDGPLDYHTEGSGQGPTLTVANGLTLVVDGDFENWGGSGNNTPSNWTIGNGTAGTHIFREATNVYRGTYGLKFLGTGAQATMGVEQSIGSSVLKARRRYLVCLRLKASGVPAAGQVEVHWSGTGYSKTAPAAEVQSFQVSGTPTGGTYTLTYTGPYGGAQTTAAIAYTATSATVQAALRLLAGLESVVVAASAGAPADVTHAITFRGVQGDVTQLTSTSSLTGGTPVLTHGTTTPGVEGDCVVLPAAAFPTTWMLAYFWINLPVVIPSDWKLVVQVASTLSNAVALYVDSLALAPVDYHGGVGANLVAGATRFVAGDRFSFSAANNQAGKLQDFFRQWYRFQLPSSGSPSIDDALAT